MTTFKEILISLMIITCLVIKVFETGNLHKNYYQKEIDCLKIENNKLKSILDFYKGINNH